MQITVDRTSMRGAGRSAKPVLAAVLATGAGVTGFAHPLASPRLPPVPRAASPDVSVLVARLEVSPAVTLTPPRPIVPTPRESTPRLAESMPATQTLGTRIMEPAADPPHLVPAAPAPAPGIAAMPEPPAIAPSPISESPPALTLPPNPEPLTGAMDGTPPALEEQITPSGPPTDTDSEAPRFTASTVAQGSLGLVAPPPPAPRQPLMMPSAELKAMMATEAMRRDRPLTDNPRLVESTPPATPARAPSAMMQAIAPIADTPSATTIDRVGQTGRGIQFDVVARVNGDAAGRLPLLITGDAISVRLGDVLALLEPMMEPSQFAALSTSNSAGEYVPLNRLRASGIAVRFDARDQLIIGRR